MGNAGANWGPSKQVVESTAAANSLCGESLYSFNAEIGTFFLLSRPGFIFKILEWHSEKRGVYLCWNEWKMLISVCVPPVYSFRLSLGACLCVCGCDNDSDNAFNSSLPAVFLFLLFSELQLKCTCWSISLSRWRYPQKNIEKQIMSKNVIALPGFLFNFCLHVFRFLSTLRTHTFICFINIYIHVHSRKNNNFLSFHSGILPAASIYTHTRIHICTGERTTCVRVRVSLLNHVYI